MESIKLVAEYVSHLPVVAKIAPALSNRRGVAALEYGLIASLIAVVIITAVSTLGDNMSLMFDEIAGKINTTIPE
ncbi:MAG TPA: Flp family type IVb pilin [Skermanella sp.]|jgi:pilus assembly protein Flp/PilA|nr:Flp family type IVb pilin [Skermanella sp.]